MKFRIEEDLSQETKEHLYSLQIKNEYGKIFNCEKINKVIIEEESNNMLFLVSFHSNYPNSILYEYYLIYNCERVIIDIESYNPFEHKMLRLRIPEMIWKEKDDILKFGIEMIYLDYKTEGPREYLESIDWKREKFFMNTDDISYFREKN